MADGSSWRTGSVAGGGFGPGGPKLVAATAPRSSLWACCGCGREAAVGDVALRNATLAREIRNEPALSVGDTALRPRNLDERNQRQENDGIGGETQRLELGDELGILQSRFRLQALAGGIRGGSAPHLVYEFPVLLTKVILFERRIT